MKKKMLLSTLYATILTLLALELIVRIIFGTNSTKLYNVTIPDPILHHRTRPNLSAVDNGRSIPYTHRTNSQSFVEDDEISRTKPSDTFRIFYVGDSNVVGLVDSPKKMVDMVETELNKLYMEKGLKFEVINTGTASYSPLLYYLLIKSELIKYQPDLIVINVDMTDVVNDAVYRKTVVEDKEGNPVAVAPSGKDKGSYRTTPQGVVKLSPGEKFREQMNRFLTGYSVLYYQLGKFGAKIFGKEEVVFEPHVTLYKENEDKTANWLAKTWTKEIEENVSYSMKILGLTFAFLKEKGIKVFLTGVPHAPQFTGEWSVKPHEVLGETAAKYNVPYLNTYKALEKYATASGTLPVSYFWREDPTHLNIEGNAAWAKIQMEFLLDEKNGLLPNQN